jgi:3-deoxy-7-phosphoheptulonate synthase
MVESYREQIRKILTWEDSRKILIIWPCSADFEDSLNEYAEFLAKINDEVKDRIFIIMRFYTWKPRTINWWKWMIQDGIKGVREMWIKLTEKHNLPLADEMLNPHLLDYVDDIYTYLAIWARSTENQYHREVSSWLYIPVWMKNPTSWNIEIMVNSIKAWQYSHTYNGTRQVYETEWNPFCHWILRWWENWSNYSLEHILKAYHLMEKGIKNPSLIIDTSHDNWRINGVKHPENQVNILKSVMKDIQEKPELLDFVKWFMVESYLFDWKQDEKIEYPKHWLSLTDPCIWLEKTKELIYTMYYYLKK